MAKRIVVRSGHKGLMARILFWQRWICTSYLEVERFVPKQGRILDLGCGWGWFSQALVLTSAGRRVFGFDISLKRLKEAGCFGSPFFALGTLEAVRGEALQAIVIYDVLHHLNYRQQEQCLAQAWRCLSKRGELIIKENGTSPRWKYVINYLIEIMAIAARYTVSKPLSFRSQEEWQALLEKTGFKTSILPLKTWHLWPDLLIIATK